MAIEKGTNSGTDLGFIKEGTNLLGGGVQIRMLELEGSGCMPPQENLKK